MAQRLERLIRDWGRWPDAAAKAAPAPSSKCLSFAQALQLAQGQSQLPPSVREHAESCAYCRKLVEDFREALAEPAHKLTGARLWLHRVQSVAVAAAAIILIATVVTVGLRHHEPGDILAGAQVGLRSEVESGNASRGGAYASGEMIGFRLDLRDGGQVALVQMDPSGKFILLPPRPSVAKVILQAPMGRVILGPYRLDEQTGEERFFVIASRRLPADLPQRLESLGQSAAGNVQAVEAAIRAWPADVQVIAFQHVAAK